jgi:hypothetical protein
MGVGVGDGVTVSVGGGLISKVISRMRVEGKVVGGKGGEDGKIFAGNAVGEDKGVVD